MTERTDRWALVDRVFVDALELPLDEREAFLVDRCGADTALLDEVRELLAASEDVDFFGEQVDPGSLRSMLRDAAGHAPSGPDSEDPLIGQTLGAFRVLRVLGHGGMGSVYLAERIEGFEQRVAIKTLRRGIDTDEVVQRFLAERQILAQLDHPNIASLFDGGSTPDGRPYFVMEFVQGQPITKYADEAGLGIPERLDLLKTVASAIHHAHQHLVVHRDLKPSNVFVTFDGAVKLLDFGIARLIGSEHRWGQTRTSTGFRILTPAYAAPEQVARGPVTTATDVYQLGALFYELMTGARPFPRELSEPELEQRILDQHPEALSRTASQVDRNVAKSRGFSSSAGLAQRLSGDLDVIAATALAKEPGRRYGSVEAMAADIQQHLAGRPISARPATAAYHFGRFVRRNRWFVPTCAAAAAGMVLYVGTSVQHNRALTAERDRAEAVTDFVSGLFNSANPWTGGVGADVTVLEALDAGARRAEVEFADQPAIQARLLEVIGSSYYGLNRSEDALELQVKAVALREKLDGADALVTLRGRHMLALTTRASVGPDSALSLQLPVLETLEAGTDPNSKKLRAEVLGEVAWTYWRMSDFENALDYYKQADVAFEELDPAAPAEHGEVLRHYSRALAQASQNEEAFPLIQRSVELLESALPADDIRVAAARQDLGSAHSDAGRYEESLVTLRSALATFEEQLEPNDPNVLGVRGNIGYALLQWGRLDEAEAAYREIIRLYETREEEEESGLAGAVQNLAVIVSQQGRLAEAVPLSLRAHEIYEQSLGDHFQTAFPLLTITGIQLDGGHFSEALPLTEEAFDILARTLPEGHFARAVALCRRGRARWGVGRSVEGIADLQEALAALEAGPPASTESYREECGGALSEAVSSY